MRDRGGTRTRPPKRQTKGAADLGSLAGSVGASQPKRPPPPKHQVDRTMVRATQTGRALTPAESRRAASRFGAFAASVIDVGLRHVAHERPYDSPQAERLRRQQQAALTSPASIDRLMRATPSFSSAVNSLGENTLGVSPTHVPGNILRNVGIHTRLPQDTRGAGDVPLYVDQRNRLVMGHGRSEERLPFVPGSAIRRLAGVRRAAPAEAALSRKAARSELENHPFRQAFHANIDRTVADKQLASKMKQTFDRQTLAGAKKAGMRPGKFLEHLRGSEPTPVEHARQRLAQVEGTIESALQGIEKDMKARMGGKFDPAETIRRNRAKAQAQGKIGGRRAQARGKLEEQRTQAQELRDDAWTALLKYAERDDNVGRTVKGWLDEHDRLRAVVDQHDEQHLFQEPPVGEPPVPAGHVRLYRGEGARTGDLSKLPGWIAENRGRWFTDNKTLAERYAARENGVLHYVDVPENVAKSSIVHAADDFSNWNEYVLPIEHAARSVPAATAAESATPTAQPEAAQKLIAGLSAGGAKALRHEQELGYSAERARRAGAFNEALRANPTMAGHAEARKLLAGALPKVEFNGIRGLTADEVDALVAHASDHPGLKPFEKEKVISATIAAWEHGAVPTDSERRLLNEAFGTNFATKAFEPKVLSKYQRIGQELMLLPRSLQATLDVSATFRQLLVAFGRHPLLTGRNVLKSTPRFLVSEPEYKRFMDELPRSPDYEELINSGLDVTDLEHAAAGREEPFQGQLAEKVGGRFSPVRAAGRAFTGTVVKTRVDIYRLLRDSTESAGQPLSDEAKKQLAKYINETTGRGNLPNFLEGSAVPLNALLFSPRLMFSRLAFFNPRNYLSREIDPFVRKQYMRAALQTTAGVGAVLWLGSQVPGVKVSINPLSSDFGKMRVGNTRIDVAGGFVQYVRMLSALAVATVGQGDGKTNDQLMRFIRGKESPFASVVHDFATHTNYAGLPLNDWKKEIYDSFIPLVIQDIRDTYEQTGSIPAAVGAAAASGTGIGVQSYGAKPTGPKHDTSPEGVAKTYIQQAEKVYPQLSESVRRAVRGRMLYEQAVDQFKQDKYGGKQHAMTDREEAQILLNVRIQEQPGVFTPENTAAAQQIVQQGSPYAVSSFIRFSKKSLWEEVLRPIDKTLAARRKAKSFRQWQKTHR